MLWGPAQTRIWRSGALKGRKMDYFKTHDDRGHLLYNNYLVWNLPKADMDACMEKLKQGKLYDKFAGYVLRSFVKDLQSGYEEVYNSGRYDNENCPVVTLIIDDKFNMTYPNAPKTRPVIITDGRENVHGMYADIVPWLAPHLEKMGFAPHIIKKGRETIWLKNGLYDAWITSMQ